MMASLAPEYPFELQVKNTFLHSPMGHHWYTEGVSAMRRVASAPSLHQGCVDDVFDALEYGSAEVMLASADAGDRLCLAKPPPSVLLLANSSTPKSAGEGDAEASSADECTDIDGHNSGSADGASPRCGSPVLSPSSTSASGGSFRSNSPTPCDSFASEVVFPTVGVQEVEQKKQCSYFAPGSSTFGIGRARVRTGRSRGAQFGFQGALVRPMQTLHVCLEEGWLPQWRGMQLLPPLQPRRFVQTTQEGQG